LTEAAPTTPDSRAANSQAAPLPERAVIHKGGALAPPLGKILMVSARNGLAKVTMNAAPLSGLISVLMDVAGRQIVDETGLKGTYDITLQFLREDDIYGWPRPAVMGALSDSSGPSIFTALQEQLGLNLESKKGPVDVLVVDHIEAPSPK
jgi:uncharacterized protein (TIGR03435 family)